MGTNFETAIKELVLDPLGLKMSFFFFDDVVTHRFAVGHEVINKEPKVARPWAVERSSHPAGGIVCSIKDLLRYACFHMGDGTTSDGIRLLSQELLELMQTPMFPSSGINMIDLSWAITTIDGSKMISHFGHNLGQHSYMRIVPSRKFAVAVLANSDDGGGMCYEVANAATKEYLGLTLPEALPLQLPEEKLRSYVGKYDAAGEICEIYFRDGELFLQLTDKGGFPTPDSPLPQAPPSVRLVLYGEDRVIALDEPMKDAHGEFLRNPDNSIVWFRFYSRVHARQG